MSRAISPHEGMRLAIDEARRGAGFVAPNPPVGCVIVDRNHHLLAKGFHRRVGFDHAEIDALKKIQDQSILQGAHVYVTLEPCAHHGRTPPCAEHLAKLPLASLTYGLRDPDLRTSGKGALILQTAGIKTLCWQERGDIESEAKESLAKELEELAEIFLFNARQAKPFVSVKIASSLDGKIAVSSGESKWLTGADSRKYTHVLRAAHDAVLVGRTTFELDNPLLNVRHEAFPAQVTKAIILDSQARLLPSIEKSEAYKCRKPEDLIVIVGKGHALKSRATVVECAMRDGKFDLQELLSELWKLQIRSVFVEGGAETYSHFFSAGLVQRLHLFMAPCVVGGRYGVAWSRGFGWPELSQKLNLQNVKQNRFGDDIYVTGRVF